LILVRKTAAVKAFSIDAHSQLM